MLLVYLAVFAATASAGSFPCRLSEIRGMVEPGAAEEVKPQFSCERLCDRVIFPLVGDVDKFFVDSAVDVQVETTLLVPESAVDNGNINVDVPGITVSARRNQAPSFPVAGIVNSVPSKVLIIRVVFKDGTKPELSDGTDLDADRLHKYVFNDAHNLNTFYKQCSNGNVQFQPATGSYKGLSDGVITLVYPEQTSVCADDKTRKTKCTWKTVGNTILSQLAKIGGIDYRYKMLVMPKEVDFEGAAAYGSRPGTTTWYKGDFATMPVVQVHELGHNLGLEHSGKGDKAYGDGTGWMGNNGRWDEVGSQMCFNSAKNWALGWFSQWHAQFDSRDGVSYRGKFVGIDDVVKGRISGDQKLILKMTTESQTEDTYLMFNAKVGINSGVPQDGNKVVLVSAARGAPQLQTWVKAALLQGQTYSDSGIVVKVCSIQLGSSSQVSTADVLVYKKGQTVTCSSSPATKHPTKRPTSPTPQTTTGECADCVANNNGKLTCCLGSWKNQCRVQPTAGKPYTWDQGLEVCKSVNTKTCDKCVKKNGIFTCCRGSWKGKCSNKVTATTPYTWEEGKQVCNPAALEVCECGERNGVRSCCFGSTWGDACTKNVEPFTWANGLAACNGVDAAKAKRVPATVAKMDENFPSSALCPVFYSTLNATSTPVSPTSSAETQLNGSDRNLVYSNVVSLFVFVLWSLF
jgi:hypothetical protein